MAEGINKDNFNDKVLNSNIPVLVDFYSDSCIPCKKIAPFLGDLEDEHEQDPKVYKVNTNYDMEVAENYNVMGTPSLLLFHGGELKGRKVGALSRDDLFQWVESYL